MSFLSTNVRAQGETDLQYAQQDLQQSDVDLNKAYHDAMGSLDPASQTSLKMMQRAWIAFKEADFNVLTNLTKTTGDNVSLYNYEAKEEDEQSNALRSLGKPNGVDTAQYNALTFKTSTEADQLLNSNYRQVIGQLQPDTASAEKIAQTLWIRFRDLYCQFDTSLKGGVADDPVLRDLTLRRAGQLGRYMHVLLVMQIPVPAGGDSPYSDSDEKPTDAPLADIFRFAH